MRTIATAIVSVAMALSALGLAMAAPHIGARAAPHAAAAGASGALRITNSRDGRAVFAAGGMRPGDSVSGTVRIGNDGEMPGRFSVRGSGVEDTPGPYGGRLSERVQLRLIDVTDAQQPLTLYAGLPGGLGELDLGTIAPGARRDYELTAALPDGGLPGTATGGDNRFQGSALSVGVAWAASAAAPAPPPPPAPLPAPLPAPPPATVAPVATPGAGAALPSTASREPTGDALADAVGLPPAQRCVRSRRLTVRLKGPGGARIRSATVSINGKVKRRLNASSARRPVKLRRLPVGRVTLKVLLRTTDGRSHAAVRVYRSCASKKVRVKVKAKRR